MRVADRHGTASQDFLDFVPNADPSFIDYTTHDIGAWLTDILGDEAS